MAKTAKGQRRFQKEMILKLENKIVIVIKLVIIDYLFVDDIMESLKNLNHSVIKQNNKIIP